jgi:hypothetical protein
VHIIGDDKKAAHETHRHLAGVFTGFVLADFYNAVLRFNTIVQFADVNIVAQAFHIASPVTFSHPSSLLSVKVIELLPYFHLPSHDLSVTSNALATGRISPALSQPIVGST